MSLTRKELQRLKEDEEALVMRKGNKRSGFRKMIATDVAFKLLKIVSDRKRRSPKRFPQVRNASKETVNC